MTHSVVESSDALSLQLFVFFYSRGDLNKDSCTCCTFATTCYGAGKCLAQKKGDCDCDCLLLISLFQHEHWNKHQNVWSITAVDHIRLQSNCCNVFFSCIFCRVPSLTSHVQARTVAEDVSATQRKAAGWVISYLYDVFFLMNTWCKRFLNREQNHGANIHTHITIQEDGTAIPQKLYIL